MSYVESTVTSGLARIDDAAAAVQEAVDPLARDDEDEETERKPPRRGSILANLLDQIDDINLARNFDSAMLDGLGAEAIRNYEIDVNSRADWVTKSKKAMRFATQASQPKQYPWPGASNIIYPLITQAALEFAARTMPAIIQGRKVVKGTIWGSDRGRYVTADGKPDGQPKLGPDGQPQWLVKPGEKRTRADKVGEYMSWQLLREMPAWQEQTDQLIHQIPIIGGAVRKSFFDPVDDVNKSLFVSLANIVWNYHAPSFKAAARRSEKILLYPHEILEMERAGREGDDDEGMFLALDYAASGGAPSGEDFGLDAGLGEVDQSDDMAPHLFIEQHLRLDLDDDGYPEPYVLTVHQQSGKVVRLVARYDEDGIEVVKGDDDTVLRISEIEHYTLYPFLPSIDGGSYPMGFGHILKPINEAINTTYNQLFDAGHLANAGGGFISDQLGLPSGQTLFSVGKYTRVTTKGAAIRDAVMPLPFPGPNAVLFEILGALVAAGEKIGGIGNILSGDASIANAPPTTILALIEQGMKFYTAIVQRVFNAMGEEFEKLYRLNSKHLTKTREYQVGDEWLEITPEDFRLAGGVEPVADPSQTTDMQKIGRATVLMGFKDDPLVNQQEIRRRFFEAAGCERIDELLAPPDPMAQQAAQMEMAVKQAELGRIRAQELKDQTQAFLNMALARKNANAKEEAWIQAQLQFLRFHIEALNTSVKAAAVDHKFHDTNMQAATAHAQMLAQSAGLPVPPPDVQPTPTPAGPFPVPPAAPTGPDVVNAASAGTGTPAVPGGAPMGLPGRAAGGPVDAGQPYVVGEEGPEVIVPQQSGTVIPNDGAPTHEMPAEAPDMTDRYNTELTPDEQVRFGEWQRANPRLGNLRDYDAQGFWKSGLQPAANGHGDDAYKKPNHPTFSDQSIYSGHDGQVGGQWRQNADGAWSFAPSSTNLQFYPPDHLQSYFKSVEPDAVLILPPKKKPSK